MRKKSRMRKEGICERTRGRLEKDRELRMEI